MDDRTRWDSKHASRAGSPESLPEPFVLEVLDDLAAGAYGAELLRERAGPPRPEPPRSEAAARALDLACGRGRHALELARRGFDAEGWDVSPVGLDLLAAEARARGLLVRTRVVDLGAPLPTDALGAFALCVCVNFLERALLAGVHRLLAPGGLLVYSTFTSDHPGEHPGARFRLQAGELARGLPGLRVLRSEETGGRAFLVARRAGQPG